jgi:hypothetical protein
VRPGNAVVLVLYHFVIVNRSGYKIDVSARLVELIGNENMFDIERLRVKINNETKNLGFGNLIPHNYKKQIKNYDYANI